MTEPLTFASKEQLNIIEVFSSVQGETSFAGLPTTFIRLAACNLRCAWCDTSYSFGRGDARLISQILEQVEAFGCQNVCVTGGEPLLQKNVHILMSSLCDKNYTVSLETGGSLPIDRVDPRVHIILDVKCPDSQMSDRNFWPNLSEIRPQDEVKFVVNGYQDYLYAKEVCEKFQLFSRKIPVLLSPVFDVLEAKELVGWILQDKLPVRLNMQLHKFIWSSTTRGV
ncbi:radical SAM protein [Parachlamydia sp. AcF125]|uniref:radical SAM protein n=1 Tax=Parachlamydia sp. AcF125 TaxID=2795736 RepID=UPI001BCA0606|nr:radical SAM protein [Parachlamydia sp. AcF125]MBS4168420.1 7-carboxy-7-deazaguanine synthase [Parachlamydia sp. AcF125]